MSLLQAPECRIDRAGWKRCESSLHKLQAQRDDREYRARAARIALELKLQLSGLRYITDQAQDEHGQRGDQQQHAQTPPLCRSARRQSQPEALALQISEGLFDLHALGVERDQRLRERANLGIQPLAAELISPAKPPDHVAIADASNPIPPHRIDQLEPGAAKAGIGDHNGPALRRQHRAQAREKTLVHPGRCCIQ